jgi:hypothetical protein
MSYQDLVRPHAGFHPEQVEHYQPDLGMSSQRKLTAAKYDGLTDNSTYAMYAWAFLRRNKFYQALVDKRSDKLFPLPMWGYRQSDNTHNGSTWEYHCGLCTVEPHKLKPYCEDYAEGVPLLWFPLEYLRQSMCGEIGRKTELEDPTTQLQITLDLGHKFAPDVAGLQMQLAIARQCIEANYKVRAGNAPLAQLEINDPKKSNLRRYLYIVDQMTGKRGVKKPTTTRVGVVTPLKPQGVQTLEVSEIAKRINSWLGSAAKATTDSVGKDANMAFGYVYQWQCLALLTLQNGK